tara:strand:+ start:1975 stop:2160 length:186 start_codon:yes stop_codon:yes gene_type:complete
MKDLITALGLLLFLEGLVIAIFPSRMKSIVKIIENMPINKLRFFGSFLVITGFIIIWLVKK